ncbi:carcinoembryonic antigen-related cell adhesion molecule 1-like isoform X2 [Salvelinus namaycush]|uniref:Carcinoembryonic antigen-related cell adhesion molecule 1-like isoform X2 n=1 Tax=Salvelinus namaycush TaxID=8040 RepID=A0A8U1EQJ1_SALNM|nr:carcinoembryonic antigen-related cell adhesion molecule 1-like isoform X2 [Salvelinus namaycush]
MGQYSGSMGVTLLWTLLWISRCGQGLSTEPLSKKIFFLAKTNNRVTLQVSPAVPEGTAHQWMWTSHDGRHSNTSVALITSSMNRNPSWNIQSPFSQGTGYDLSFPPKCENAGEFVFMQTKPASAVLERFEVFGFVLKVTPNYNGSQVYLGSDVSVRCEVSSLPDGATLQWERDGDSTSNTTLFYNKTAHMIIHTVDQNYQGRFNCNFRLNGELLFTVYTTLNVRTDTFNKPLIHLFRESSNSSEMKLICRSSNTYRRAAWTMSRSTSVTLTSSDKIRSDRFSSPPFNRYDFPLHVSPVTFEDSGTFACFFDNQIFGLVKLTTFRVSESGGPPGGQPVVLTCELSEVSGEPVTLAWMRMEGSRGLLVKQDVLTESHPNRMLSVTLPSLRRDQLHWQCAVFTEGMLRATASLTLTLPTQTTMSSMTVTTDIHLQTVVIVACIAMVVAGVLVGALVFYLKRKKTAVTNLPLTQKNDPVYDNITDPRRDQESQKGRTGEDENEEVHYSEFALGEPRLGDPNRVTAGSNQESAVIYSTLNI